MFVFLLGMDGDQFSLNPDWNFWKTSLPLFYFSTPIPQLNGKKKFSLYLVTGRTADEASVL